MSIYDDEATRAVCPQIQDRAGGKPEHLPPRAWVWFGGSSPRDPRFSVRYGRHYGSEREWDYVIIGAPRGDLVMPRTKFEALEEAGSIAPLTRRIKAKTYPDSRRPEKAPSGPVGGDSPASSTPLTG